VARKRKPVLRFWHDATWRGGRPGWRGSKNWWAQKTEWMIRWDYVRGEDDCRLLQETFTLIETIKALIAFHLYTLNIKCSNASQIWKLLRLVTTHSFSLKLHYLWLYLLESVPEPTGVVFLHESKSIETAGENIFWAAHKYIWAEYDPSEDLHDIGPAALESQTTKQRQQKKMFWQEVKKQNCLLCNTHMFRCNEPKASQRNSIIE